MTIRTEVPAETMENINQTANELGYTAKRIDAAKSRWKLINKLLAYAKSHKETFKI